MTGKRPEFTVFVTGTRGIPDVPGGVETHCREIYPRMAAKGVRVVLSVRPGYVRPGISGYKGVELVRAPAPRSKHLEAFIHTFLSVIAARRLRADVVHIHAVGPALLAPLARLLGLPVVMTHHGPDYERAKWGRLAKAALKLGEWAGVRFATRVIAVSPVIGDAIRHRCASAPEVIPNGAPRVRRAENTDFIERMGASPGRYILCAARLVPEKGILDLIHAFAQTAFGKETDVRLMIAGDADHESDYAKEVRRASEAEQRVILAGYLTGEALAQAFTHARLFVLPSRHEGLPVALLEALAYGVQVLASDIPANRCVGLPDACYFPAGDAARLGSKMAAILDTPPDRKARNALRKRILERFDWDASAAATLAVLTEAAGKMGGGNSWRS